MASDHGHGGIGVAIAAEYVPRRSTTTGPSGPTGLSGRFFFFSSRRRHTRFDCDWSSDVCSSDLVADAAAFTRVVTIVRRHGGPRPVVVVSALAGMTDALFAGAAAAAEGDVARARGIVDEQLARHDGVGRALLHGDAAPPFQDQLAHARDELAGLDRKSVV